MIRDVGQRVNDLTVTERGLKDTASFLEGVLTGSLLPDELPFRFRARGGYARTANGAPVFRGRDGLLGSDSTVYSSTLRETRSVTAEQQEVIRYISNSAASREVKARTAQAAGVAREVVRDSLSIQAVAERTKQLGLDDTAATDFIVLTNFNGQFPDKTIGRAIEALFVSGDDAGLLRVLSEQRAKYADISDTSEMRTDITTLETYIQTARRISIRSRFWQQSGNVNIAFQTLEQYEVIDDTDKLLVQELRSEALAIRRDALIAGVYEKIGQQTPDFTAAAGMLGNAAKVVETLRDEKGGQVLATLVESVYQGEVNLFFGNLVKQLTLDRQQIAEVVAQLDTAPVRPGIAGVDYFTKFLAAKEQFLSITDRLDAFAFEGELVQLRKRFVNEPDVQALIQEIVDLPGETAEDSNLRQALLDELALITTARRGIDPGRFALLKEVEVEGLRARRPEQRTKIDLTETNPERNIGAVKNLVRRFESNVMPLFEALRGGFDGKILTNKYVSGEVHGKDGNREAYVQRVKALEEQRDLTDIEHAYLESVQLLTVFNPHLIALAREHSALTSLYLEEHFNSLDTFTKNNLVPGAYVPVLQIGLGPNGLAAAGELNRCNAEAAAQTLYIDAAALPGGPFAVAKGLSWELNSANSIGNTTNVLPDILPSDQQGISVRSYGSPLVAYPGERKEGSDIRQGSINVTVDYLPNPDNVSTKRYPTNVDLARILQLQSAMLVDNVMLSTRVVRAEPTNDGQPGNTRVTLEYQTPQGETVVTNIRTDNVLVLGGLGEPNYGIKLEGSQAERVLQSEKQASDGFPRFTDTIGAFAALSNPESEPASPKGTIVIYGGGNSADVLIEYLGRQFESGNPNLNGISKVYVVTNAPLSKRPRYAQINDLKSRNGQPNFLELVQQRVNDVQEGANNKLQLLDRNGRPIQVGRNGGTKVLEADHVIAASGFQPDLDSVFKDLLADGESLDRRTGIDKVSLPSNPGFSIADQLRNNPNVLVAGTGSRADFKNPNKLGQLPDLAREALLRNGAENAVAIGFRTPDTRAAIRLKFQNLAFRHASELPLQQTRVVVNANEFAPERSAIVIPKATRLPSTRRDVESDSNTLSALFLGSIPQVEMRKNGTKLANDDTLANRSYQIMLNFNEEESTFTISGDVGNTPAQLQQIISAGVTNPYFQAYALKALRGRRVNRGIEISLAFNRGRLQFRDPGEVEGKGRTFVEVL